MELQLDQPQIENQNTTTASNSTFNENSQHQLVISTPVNMSPSDETLSPTAQTPKDKSLEGNTSTEKPPLTGCSSKVTEKF